MTSKRHLKVVDHTPHTSMVLTHEASFLSRLKYICMWNEEYMRRMAQKRIVEMPKIVAKLTSLEKPRPSTPEVSNSSDCGGQTAHSQKVEGRQGGGFNFETFGKKNTAMVFHVAKQPTLPATHQRFSRGGTSCVLLFVNSPSCQ